MQRNQDREEKVRLFLVKGEGVVKEILDQTKNSPLLTYSNWQAITKLQATSEPQNNGLL